MPPSRVQRLEDGGIAGGRRHDRHAARVLGGRPDHRGAADVDLLDQAVEVQLAAGCTLGGGAERVEVHDDELERLDRRGRQLDDVVGVAAIGEDPGVDPRVQRLHPPVEHLGEARDGRDVGDRQAGLAERPGGPAGADQLEASRDEPRAEVREPGLVRDREKRTPRPRQGGHRAGGIDRHARSVHRQRTAQEQGDRPGQEPVLDRVEPIEESPPRPRRDGRPPPPRGRSAPPSSDASTRCTVTPVTAAPAASASRTACAPGKLGRSDGCTLRTRFG